MKVKDPVCGMTIDAIEVWGRTDHQGQVYYFCSSGCKKAFDKTPTRYIGKAKEDIREPATLKSILPLTFRGLRIILTALREIWTLRNFARLSPETRLARQQGGFRAQRFVRALLDLGPTFVKIGQILSTRPELLPQEYITALALLHESVPPFAFSQVQASIQEAFGKDLKQLFKSFEEQPVASASLAQVHFAVLPDGTEVAVKVQRPGIRKTINEDMIVLSWMITALSWLFPVRVQRLNLVDGFKEFRRYTLHELDFSLEGETLERFQENFAGWEDVIIPEVSWEITAPTVLTMSRVAGLRLSEATHKLSPVERRRLNRRILEVTMKMFISDGFFHADLHPGNVFFQPDGKIVLLDVGMYGELTEEQRDHFILYMLAISQKQTRRAFHHLVKQTRRLDWAREQDFYREFKALAEAFFDSTLSQMTLAKVYLGIIIKGAKYGFIFPSDLLLHAKAITTAEALAFTLVPDQKFEEEIKPIISREFSQRVFDGKRLVRRVEQILPELLLEGEIPPREVQEDYREDASTEFLWTEAVKALSTRLNELEQSAGLLKTITNPYSRKVLSQHYSADEVDEILERTWTRYLELEPSIPFQSNFGARFTVHAAAVFIAMYEVLTAVGQSNEAAADLIYRWAWEVYSIMGDLPWFLGGAFTQDPYKRLKLATDGFRAFPFGPPAYHSVDVEAGDNIVAFDMHRCPVADYFAAHNLSELCVKTFCKLDIPLAQQWDAHLSRRGTIASGASTCDFRWQPLRKVAKEQRLPPDFITQEEADQENMPDGQKIPELSK